MMFSALVMDAGPIPIPALIVLALIGLYVYLHKDKGEK